MQKNYFSFPFFFVYLLPFVILLGCTKNNTEKTTTYSEPANRAGVSSVSTKTGKPVLSIYNTSITLAQFSQVSFSSTTFSTQNSSSGVPTHYAITPALPEGLSFNSSTGVVTGTLTDNNLPYDKQQTVQYKLTAWNEDNINTQTPYATSTLSVTYIPGLVSYTSQATYVTHTGQSVFGTTYDVYLDYIMTNKSSADIKNLSLKMASIDGFVIDSTTCGESLSSKSSCEIHASLLGIYGIVSDCSVLVSYSFDSSHYFYTILTQLVSVGAN